MKKNFKKAVSIILAVCFAVTLLASCSDPGAFSVNKKTVMTVADYEVTYDEYRWFYYNCMIDMEANEPLKDFDFTDPDTLALLKQNTETAIRKYYAIIYLCDKYGIELSDDDEKQIDSYMKEYVASFDSKNDYKSELKANRITGDVYRAQYAQYYYYNPYLWELLISGYDGVIAVDEKTVRSDIADNFYHYKQIFIPFVEGSNAADDKKLADGALKKLKRGEDFDTVEGSVYNARKGAYQKLQEISTDGADPHVVEIFATLNEKAKVIEKAVLALDIGELSEVFFAENGEYSGYFVIKRLPIEEEDINKNFDGLLKQSATRRYNEYIEKFASELTVTYGNYYNSLSHGMLVSK